MKLLVLGGTVFAGRHVVDAALARGHQVTLFTRGQHNIALFPQAERLRGDRDGDLDALRGRRWDAAIDMCGYVPRVVRASAELLADKVAHYTFISTISVYSDTRQQGLQEHSSVGTLDDESVEEVTGENYGPLKALCERAAEVAMPGRVLVARPGLIVGPHDPTDRFTYWPHRLAGGGEALAPGRSQRGVQFIDARDLAAWTLEMVERGATGVYNVTGPERPLPMGQLLDECAQASADPGSLTWVDEDFLLEAGVQPWSELPLWLPEHGEASGLFAVDCRKAIAEGLTFRPSAQTVRDTLAWDTTLPPDREWRAGITRDREDELLRKWHSC